MKIYKKTIVLQNKDIAEIKKNKTLFVDNCN